MSKSCVYCGGGGRVPVGKVPFTKNLYLTTHCPECHGTGLQYMGYERSEWKKEIALPKCEPCNQPYEFVHMSADRFQMFQCPGRK